MSYQSASPAAADGPSPAASHDNLFTDSEYEEDGLFGDGEVEEPSSAVVATANAAAAAEEVGGVEFEDVAAPRSILDGSPVRS